MLDSLGVFVRALARPSGSITGEVAESPPGQVAVLFFGPLLAPSLPALAATQVACCNGCKSYRRMGYPRPSRTSAKRGSSDLALVQVTQMCKLEFIMEDVFVHSFFVLFFSFMPPVTL